MVVAVAPKPSIPSVGAPLGPPAAGLQGSGTSVPYVVAFGTPCPKGILLRVLVVESGTVVPESYYICF